MENNKLEEIKNIVDEYSSGIEEMNKETKALLFENLIKNINKILESKEG